MKPEPDTVQPVAVVAAVGFTHSGLFMGDTVGRINMQFAFSRDPEAMRRILQSYYIWQAKRAFGISTEEGEGELSEHNDSFGSAAIGRSSIVELQRIRDKAKGRH